MIDDIVVVKEKNTKRIRCRCHSPFQDGRYGDMVRVHNKMGKSGGQWWRCAVCGMEKANGSQNI